MITFFATILIVYVGWLVIRPLVARYVRRKMAERMNDFFAGQFGARPQYTGQNQADRSPRHRRRTRNGKIFSRDEGEYVEFEDIRVSTTDTHREQKSTYTPTEPQVSDAEWEDL